MYGTWVPSVEGAGRRVPVGPRRRDVDVDLTEVVGHRLVGVGGGAGVGVVADLVTDLLGEGEGELDRLVAVDLALEDLGRVEAQDLDG